MFAKIILLVTFMLSFDAMAEISANFAVTSDYVWRGQTGSNHGPAVQGGMDYEHKSGFSLGTWLSNASTGNATEADFYANYGHFFNDNFSLSIGGTFYHYTRSGVADSAEINLGVELWQVNLGINFMDDYFGSGSNSWYYSLGYSFDVNKSAGLSLGLSVGYTTFDSEGAVGSKNYLDYMATLEKSFDKDTISLWYTDTDRKTALGADQDDHVFGLSATRSF